MVKGEGCRVYGVRCRVKEVVCRVWCVRYLRKIDFCQKKVRGQEFTASSAEDLPFETALKVRYSASTTANFVETSC